MARVLMKTKSGNPKMPRRWTTLPPAAAEFRGVIAYLYNPTGVMDSINICLKDAAGQYAWFQLYGGNRPGTEWKDDFRGTVLDPDWSVTINGFGNVVMLVGAAAIDNGGVQLQDTGVAGANDAQISLGTNRWLRGALRPSFETRISLNPVLAANGTRARSILHNAGAYNAVGDWFGFEFGAVASPNWRSRATSGGGAVRDFNTGIPVAAGTLYILRSDFLADGTILQSINYTVVDTIPAVNATAQRVEPLLYVDDGGVGAGAAINLIADYVWANQARV